MYKSQPFQYFERDMHAVDGQQPIEHLSVVLDSVLVYTPLVEPLLPLWHLQLLLLLHIDSHQCKGQLPQYEPLTFAPLFFAQFDWPPLSNPHAPRQLLGHHDVYRSRIWEHSRQFEQPDQCSRLK